VGRRPAIPNELERAVLLECGHRCAISTCREHPVEIAHILPWSKCKEHKFENLIGLCPTCHTRYDKGEIDHKSMRIYKSNLFVFSGRYGELEKRVLKRFVQDRKVLDFWWFADMDILLRQLVEDGLLQDTGQTKKIGGLVQRQFVMTKKCSECIDQWPLD